MKSPSPSSTTTIGSSVISIGATLAAGDSLISVVGVSGEDGVSISLDFDIGADSKGLLDD